MTSRSHCGGTKVSELLKINVNDHVERKGQLSYLSWAWAWAEVLKIDSAARYTVHEYDNLPAVYLKDGTAMVKVSVEIRGDIKTCLLPVMDNRNKAIANPDAFAINTAIMRCMTKCIALYGLGLYIYAGEDLPPDAEINKPPPQVPDPPKKVDPPAPAVEVQTAQTENLEPDFLITWADQQIAGMAVHKHLGQLLTWRQTSKITLQQLKENQPEKYSEVVNEYQKRKLNLQGVN